MFLEHVKRPTVQALQILVIQTGTVLHH